MKAWNLCLIAVLVGTLGVIGCSEDTQGGGGTAGTAGSGGTGGAPDPNELCNEGECSEPGEKQDACKDLVTYCIAEEPETSWEQCFAFARILICGALDIAPGLWTASSSGANDFDLCFYVSEGLTKLVAHPSCTTGTDDATPQAFGATIRDGAGDGCPAQPIRIAYTEEVPITVVGDNGFFSVSNFSFDPNAPSLRASFSATIQENDEAPGDVNTNYPCNVAFTARPAP